MYKRIVLAFGTLIFVLPAFAAADAGGNSQLVSLYTQLVSLLQQELALLQNPNHPSISILPTTGAAPLAAIFTLKNPTGTESIIFGDGHSSGSNGCVKNTLGWCDLSQPIPHVYQFPGTYSISVYSHPSQNMGVMVDSAVVMVR